MLSILIDSRCDICGLKENISRYTLEFKVIDRKKDNIIEEVGCITDICRVCLEKLTFMTYCGGPDNCDEDALHGVLSRGLGYKKYRSTIFRSRKCDNANL